MDAKTAELRWGVDDAGSTIGIDRHPKGAELIEELGIDLIVHHYQPARRIADNVQCLREFDRWCNEQGVAWVANLEQSNWVEKCVDETGRDWFDQPGGLHYFLFPEELREELGRCSRLLGLMYDEAAHTQSRRHMLAELERTMFFNPDGHRLEEAADAFTEAVRAVDAQHSPYGIQIYTEHVFPVMFHCFARAGWVAATKVLKENWSPPYIACALGAALQYDTELWITPDLCRHRDHPGHSMDEYRSSLTLAYHMGADCIYTENLAYDHESKGIGSLVLMTADDFRLTEYGRTTQWFRRTYIPAHPRQYTFRDIRPRVAIVRQPDGCWGQSQSWWLPDYLFGSKEWQSTEITEAWLRIWHLLSRGVIHKESLSWHNAHVHHAPYQVFAPLDGVVVFDHLVRRKHLSGVEVIFLTGLGVSPETRRDIEACVENGATCIALPHLLPERVIAETGENGALKDEKGMWVATTDFLALHVAEHVAHVLPPADELRYRFGDTQIVFRPMDGDPNRLSVTEEPVE